VPKLKVRVEAGTQGSCPLASATNSASSASEKLNLWEEGAPLADWDAGADEEREEGAAAPKVNPASAEEAACCEEGSTRMEEASSWWAAAPLS